MTSPIISIIIPCYNQELYIADALTSVFKQTYKDWECLIIDDGSTDNSETIIKKWTDKDERFRYFYKQNGGICDTRNYGVAKARGEYILPLDGDDMLHEKYIEEVLEIFHHSPHTKLVYCDTITFGESNKIIKSSPYKYENLLFENVIPCTAIFRKKDFNKTKGYRKNMTFGIEDWDFWISFLDKNDIVQKLENNRVYYRIKAQSRSSNLEQNMNKNEAMLLQMFKNNQEKYLEYLNPIRDRINHLHYKTRYEELTNSTAYKIGSFIYSPFQMMMKLIRKFTVR